MNSTVPAAEVQLKGSPASGNSDGKSCTVGLRKVWRSGYLTAKTRVEVGFELAPESRDGKNNKSRGWIRTRNRLSSPTCKPQRQAAP
ncbi:hypothetical protein ElyMa_000552600 [Elysia marginata]|uniref:Uncharacterized protein n=1 Tax=Elysia marginata TaxID=1093978 RepID=A0AAV4G3N6_9GAST|nr:hypothetical protein ElyMa_000552600 [Elysia marginata]